MFNCDFFFGLCWVCFICAFVSLHLEHFQPLSILFFFFPPLFSFLGKVGGRPRPCACCPTCYTASPIFSLFFPLELPWVFHSHSIFHATSHIVQIMHALSLHCCILGKWSRISGLLHWSVNLSLQLYIPVKYTYLGSVHPLESGVRWAQYISDPSRVGSSDLYLNEKTSTIKGRPCPQDVGEIWTQGKSGAHIVIRPPSSTINQPSLSEWIASNNPFIRLTLCLHTVGNFLHFIK